MHQGFWTLIKKKIRCCLYILKFTMGNTIVTFLDRYYEYGIYPDPDCCGLTIRGFESAFLANLEATYLFDELHPHMEEHVRSIGTYHDDEIILFHVQCLNEWPHNWLRTFQGEVDRLLGTLDIQFTMEIWRLGQQSTMLINIEVYGLGSFQRISINGNTSFPYQDIQLLWSATARLLFNVYRKSV
jgi:hypothetical protein